MVSKSQIYKKIEREVEELELKVSNFRLYNTKAFLKRGALRSGLVLKKFVPFFLASYMIIHAPMFQSNPPFTREMRTKGAYVATMQTSNGFFEKYTSFDNKYEFNEIHYSSAWTQDKNGLYTREVTVFKLTDAFYETYKTDEIFQMSEEEIGKLLKLDTKQKVIKTRLQNEDFVYQEPTVVVFRSSTSEEVTTEVQETVWENIGNILFYFFLVAAGGYGLEFTTNIIFKHRLENGIKAAIGRNRPITQKELESLKQKLAIQKENLQLILNNNEKIEKRNLRRGSSR